MLPDPATAKGETLTMRRIGILGGAFNPPHHGHLRPATEVLEALGLDQVLLIPTGSHPFKEWTELLPAHHRLAMIRLAVEGDLRFAVSELETGRQGIAYTIDTLHQLKALHPDALLYLLLGADLMGELHLWRQWRELIHYAHLVVMTRPGYQGLLTEAPAARILQPLRAPSLEGLLAPEPPCHYWWPLPVTPQPVSSTELRAMAARGESLAGFTPDAVAGYVVRHRLYGVGSGGA